MRLGIEEPLTPEQIDSIANELNNKYPEVYGHIHQKGYKLCETHTQQNEHPGYQDDYCNGCGNHYEWCSCC